MRRRALSLADRLDALDRALELAAGRVAPERLAEAEAVRHKADERLAHGDGLLVAALVGGTGSGKSSLFNALVGAELSPVGVRRPTTDAPRAAVGDAAAAGRLLAWLDVPQRHDVGDALPDDLVLLDVPDHDSVVSSHRDAVDRLVERVDVLVWVVDPLKYAMRALHEGYLGRLASHAEVLVVVLNRVDELSDRDRAACAADLRRILDEEGLASARLVATSARTGHGIADLRNLLDAEAARHTAAALRLVGDLRAVASALSEDVGTAPSGRVDVRGLVEALAGAAGVGGVAATAGDETRDAAMAGTRPLVSRGIAAVGRRGPRLLRHLRGLLPGERTDRARATAHDAPVGVRHTLVEVVDRCADPLPPRWRSRLHDIVGADAGAVARAVAAAVDRVPLRAPRRWWWSPLAALLSVFELAAVLGAVWLAILAVLGWLQLPAPQPPTALGRVPWPTALLLGGLGSRVLGGALRRRLAVRTAARYRRRVALDLMSAVEDVAKERVVRPLQQELDDRDELRELLADLRT